MLPLKTAKYEATAQRRPAKTKRKNRVCSAKRQIVWFGRSALQPENALEQDRCVRESGAGFDNITVFKSTLPLLSFTQSRLSGHLFGHDRGERYILNSSKLLLRFIVHILYAGSRILMRTPECIEFCKNNFSGLQFLKGLLSANI